MKPSFALNLTEEGVTLLHRTARGWLDVGFAAFNNPDLTAALDYLRSTALGLSPKGLTTKVVIPRSQILYTEVDLHGIDASDHASHIATALEGRTPYDVPDLVYDWQRDGTVARVAVVARETLAEAEGFATEHRFNPMTFVTIPDPEDPVPFAGEPFFGMSDAAPSLLLKNQTLQRDDDAITIITREMPKETPKDPAGARQATPDMLGNAPQDDQPAAAPQDPAPQPTPNPDLPPEPMPGPPHQPNPVGDPVPEPAPDPDLPPEPIPGPDPVPDPFPEYQPDPGPSPEPEPMNTPDVAAFFEDGDIPPPVPGVPAPQPAPTRPVAHAFAPLVRAPTPLNGRAAEPAASLASPAAGPSASPRTVESDEAPMAVDVSDDEEVSQNAANAETPPMSVAVRTGTDPANATDDVPAPLSSAALLAFASRRGADLPPPLARGAGVADTGLRGAGTNANASPALRPVSPPGTGTPVGGMGGAGARPNAVRPMVDRPAATRPVPKFSYDDPVPPPPRMPGDPPLAQASAMGKAGRGLRSIGAMVSAPSLPGKVRKKVVSGPTSGNSPSVAPVNEPSNVATLRPKTASFARPSQPLVKPDALAKGLAARGMPQRGKPRFLGLILTGVLLLILAVVAAWSSFYLTQRNQTDPDPVAVAAAVAPATADEVLADNEVLADLAADGTATDDLQAAIAAPDAAEPDLPAEALPEALPEALTETLVVAEPAPQTGVDSDAAAVAPPARASQDEIFLAGMDTPPALNDPLVLAAPMAAGDALPAAQMPPPPFGTVYRFDENGLIEAMPGGIQTPEGVMLIAGKPPIVPPQRPATVEAAAVAATAAAEPVPADTAAAESASASAAATIASVAATAAADAPLSPEQTFAADPSLAGARPRLRPEGLAPAAPVVGADDASLAPAEDSRFASLRPRARPGAILAAGEAARVASQAASLAANAAAEAAIVEASASISPQAVSVSRVPAPRPRSLTRAVEAAVAAATRQPDTRRAAAEPEPKARTNEEADDEPEVVVAAPRIPTKANVAKQATFVNAINLSKINLIGVYGSQSRRYALIRQSNGRYKKVSVGDSIDGGRIKAITATEVRYQKGGRLLALAMPKG